LLFVRFDPILCNINIRTTHSVLLPTSISLAHPSYLTGFHLLVILKHCSLPLELVYLFSNFHFISFVFALDLALAFCGFSLLFKGELRGMVLAFSVLVLLLFGEAV